MQLGDQPLWPPVVAARALRSPAVARHRRTLAPVASPAPANPASASPRSHSRALPLIEYGADGQYVVLCPTQGRLSLVPDSPEWFTWLATLKSFTFHGLNGRFTTERKMRHGQRINAWTAYLSLPGRSLRFGRSGENDWWVLCCWCYWLHNWLRWYQIRLHQDVGRFLNGQDKATRWHIPPHSTLFSSKEGG